MKHAIEIDGETRTLDIRAMDEGFIVYRKMYTPPLTGDNIGKVNPGDPDFLQDHLNDGRFRIIESFFRKQIETVSSCMILAWEGDGVIGKMHFTTREMHEAMGGSVACAGCYCVEHNGFADKIQSFREEELERFLRSETRALRMLCFNIGHFDERYQGQGIAKAMVEYLKQWASERGWRRIEMHCCPDITPHTIIGDWMPRRGSLERRGFRVLETTQVSRDEAQRRLSEIEAYRAGRKDYPKWAHWYACNVHALAADPVWKSEYDKDYLMACEL